MTREGISRWPWQPQFPFPSSISRPSLPILPFAMIARSPGKAIEYSIDMSIGGVLRDWSDRFPHILVNFEQKNDEDYLQLSTHFVSKRLTLIMAVCRVYSQEGLSHLFFAHFHYCGFFPILKVRRFCPWGQFLVQLFPGKYSWKCTPLGISPQYMDARKLRVVNFIFNLRPRNIHDSEKYYPLIVSNLWW